MQKRCEEDLESNWGCWGRDTEGQGGLRGGTAQAVQEGSPHGEVMEGVWNWDFVAFHYMENCIVYLLKHVGRIGKLMYRKFKEINRGRVENNNGKAKWKYTKQFFLAITHIYVITT